MSSGRKCFMCIAGVIIPFYGIYLYKKNNIDKRYMVQHLLFWTMLILTFVDPVMRFFVSFVLTYYLFDIACRMKEVVMLEEQKMERVHPGRLNLGDPSAPIIAIFPPVMISTIYLPDSFWVFMVGLFGMVIFEGIWWRMHDNLIRYVDESKSRDKIEL